MKAQRATSWSALLAGLFSLLLLLSACSSNADSGNNGAAASPSPAAPQQEAAATEAPAFPRTIEAANGSITIDAKPERVAVVHWGYVDSLLLFDLPSAGLALPFTEDTSSLGTDTYKPYVDRIGELVIVGENTTVNLEALLAYGPDLIIAGSTVNAEVTEQLEKIAATVVIDEATTDVWSNWPALVTAFGQILGQEETAEQFISGYQAKVAEAKEKLADVEGNVAFLQVRNNVAYLGGTKYLTPYYDQGIGLTPPDDPAMADGAEMSLETLAALDPDHLILGYFNYDSPETASITDEWEQTEVWKKLKAVESGQTYAVNGALAMGYGPLANTYGVEALLEALDK
ncbi:ABC transporter substrate-binding protein [Paenibacillus sp. FSL R7-0331]|uniref:ABC transporter substrate-binding protein n=1 Tax=Paenibacillus sp. FSL R7-0331 TaxID=1536773 RepID=UPI0004F79BF8|nr:ABC transporter substrate-binding protein [Paenibacillus sp. FSL R7-0331]AIQ55429.1 iron ABC transporter substrate-binding protein [Paenibacillus sp. FSL R7-0331]